MSSDEDEGSYGFEYSDDDMSTGEVDIENEYYKAKGDVEQQKHAAALEGFHNVVKMQQDKSEWGFKAYKQIVKLEYKMGNHDNMLKSYKEMLTYASGTSVTKNAAEKKINSLMDYMGGCEDAALLQRFYTTTLESDEGSSNERLWFQAKLKLCELWFGTGQFGPLAPVLAELADNCTGADGKPDLKKATNLLKVYALDLQMSAAQSNFRRVKELYDKCLAIQSAISHPHTMGIIRESGGKMHMREKSWEAAHTDFFEAFKSYDDAGSAQRVQCLKYLVLASMLMESQVDPFNAQETQPYRSDPQIQAMTDLVEAYQQGNIRKFQRTLSSNRTSILEDPFIRPYIDDLMSALRTQVLLTKVLGPYNCVRIEFLANKINCTESEVERLLASLIVDGRIEGHIDQVKQLLLLDRGGVSRTGSDGVPRQSNAVDKWISTLHSMQRALLQKGTV